MKDASNYILSQLFTALNGNLSYEGNNVPYYSITQFVDDIDLYFVNAATVYELPNIGTKDTFISDYTVQLDVVSVQQNKTVSEFGVNFISNQIRTILKPTTDTIGINDSNEFQIIDLIFEDVRGSRDQDGENWRIRKILNINIKTRQK